MSDYGTRVIWGNRASGKSTKMLREAEKIEQANPNAKVLFVSMHAQAKEHLIRQAQHLGYNFSEWQFTTAQSCACDEARRRGRTYEWYTMVDEADAILERFLRVPVDLMTVYGEPDDE